MQWQSFGEELNILLVCRNCKEDAVHFCHAKKTWADIDNPQMEPETGPLVLPCLHRYAYHPEKNMQLKPECFQVKTIKKCVCVCVTFSLI